MISVVYCTRESKPEHTEHIKKTCGIKDVEVIEYVNKGEGLTGVYNRFLDEAKYDIVVYLHDDLELMTKNWGTKLIKHYKRNPEYGILGVAGSKNMPETGKWWEQQRKMYGQVYHTHEGRTWLSAYSKHLGNQLEDVVIVDGVFFSVHKQRIKESFGEDFEGFHFYDIDFCFRNYLEGVKIGVHFDIKINHYSIGETNDEWEKNREKFAEKYKEHLPVNIKRVLRPKEKLKVLIGCLSFQNYTGSEVHVLELAKELVKQDCEVTICSQIGGEISKRALACGIKLAHIQEPPGFKLGDGEWQLNTQNGLVPSDKGVLYPISKPDFDIIHAMHKPITEHLLNLYPDIETICTIHSEVIDLEHPVINPQIKKYIAIRPEIKEFLIDRFEINPDMIDVVYNPVNATKFKEVPSTKRDFKRILFVGTIDYLRKNTIEDLIATTKANGDELWIVGKKHDKYLDEMLQNESHVSYFEPTWNVEKYVQQCDETAGILLGRTTIESWLCGKPAWIYDVDDQGNISNKTLHQVPEDIDKFKSDNVASITIEKYKEILD
jgi:glycosyltransferase involved in cell wall biosynthesis